MPAVHHLCQAQSNIAQPARTPFCLQSYLIVHANIN